MAFGFLGVGLVLADKTDLTRRQMIVVVASGLACAYLLTPIALAWLKTQVSWLSDDITVAVSGTLGMAFGVAGINITGALMASGDAFKTRLGDLIREWRK